MTMTRLPQPGKDAGTWGDILNDYLSQSHNTDGTLKDNVVGANQLQDGAVTNATIAPGAITKATVGLANVDNTADNAKPVSTVQQAALDLKADTSTLATKLNTSDLDAQTAAKITTDGTATQVALSSTYDAPKTYYVDTWDGYFAGAAHPDAKWVNASHLTDAALATWAAYVLSHSPIPAAGAVKVVWFGDSWISQNPGVLAAATAAHNPAAVVVTKGVSGDKSANLIARFADVPVDADYVILNEPGVNDTYAKLTAQQVTANLATLSGLVRGIGAIPVFIGQAPLAGLLTRSQTMDALMHAQVSLAAGRSAGDMGEMLGYLLRQRTTKSQALGLGSQGDLTGTACTAFGYYSQYSLTTGASNTAVGSLGQHTLTTGASNTAIGSEAQYLLSTGNANSAFGATAQRNLSTGSYNAALGQAAQNALTTGNSNTAVGAYASLGLTEGSDNVAIGRGAGYDPGGNAAYATTTAGRQTCVGSKSGLGSATQSWYITTIGYGTKSTGAGGVAIGVDSGGVSAVAVAADEFVLGTASHKVTIPGRLNVSPRTPTGTADAQGVVGDITSDDSYVYVKTSAGWKRAALSTW